MAEDLKNVTGGAGIDPESLAALLDGTLSGVERQAVLAALAASPQDAERFAEAAAVHLELTRGTAATESASESQHPGALRRWRWPLAALPLAATIAALVLLPVLRSGGTSPLNLRSHSPWIAGAVPDLATALGPSWEEPGWPVTRGGSDDGGAAFRVGVRLVDFETASVAGDGDAARRMAGSLATLLGRQTGGAAAAALFDQLAAGGPEAVPAPRERGEAAEAAMNLFGESAALRLGLWAGQARLAALASDTAFFARGAAPHRALQDLQSSPGLDAETAGILRRLDALFSSGEPARRPAAARPYLTDLIRAAAGDG